MKKGTEERKMAFEMPDYSKMTQEEAYRRIEQEYPEYISTAIQIIRDNGNLVEFVSILDSY